MFDSIKRLVAKWRDDIAYYQYMDNIHKHPIVSRMMCALGRHDYECVATTDAGAQLQCFYCGHEKFSMMPCKMSDALVDGN